MKKNMKLVALLLSLAMVGGGVMTVGAVGDESPVKVYGDINGDGKCNAFDLTRLMKKIAGEDVEVFDSDLTGDGNTNAIDLTRLMRLLAGDYVPETNPVTETEPVVTETEPAITETEPVVTETEPVVTETEPDITETEPVTDAPVTLGETASLNEAYTPIEEKPAPTDISDMFDLTQGLVLVDAAKKSEYKIVCVGAANAAQGTTITDFAKATHEYEVAVALQDTIYDMTGCKIKIVNNTDSTSDKEIVIGSTSRDPLFADVDFTAFTGDSFAVKTYGNTILLAAAANERTEENIYQDYDLADGIWKAAEYFVKEYLHYDPATMLTTPVAKNGISVNITDYEYTDPYVTPELKENSAEKIDGFNVTGYGDVDYNGLMTHNAYVKVGVVPCYSKLTAANKKTLLNKAKSKGYLIYNTSSDHCTCDACNAAAEEEGTEMGAYFKVVREIAAQMPEGTTLRILAANETYIPPKTSLGDNVEVLIYNPKLCSAHAVNDPDCEVNTAFVANLEAWKSVCGLVSVLDFTSDYYYFPVTFPNFYTMKKNVEWYKSEGLNGVYLQFDTVQSDLEFSDLRMYLARVILENPTMSDEEYSEFLSSGLAHYYGSSNAYAMKQYIDLFTAEANKDGECYNIYSEPAEILSMKVVVDGIESYDTVFAKKAYALWEQIHPYNETLARNEAYLARMLSSRYQSEPASHAKTQYQEWLMSVVDMKDKSWVINRITNSIN